MRKFPKAEGEGRLESDHFCDPAKAAAASELVDDRLELITA